MYYLVDTYANGKRSRLGEQYDDRYVARRAAYNWLFAQGATVPIERPLVTGTTDTFTVVTPNGQKLIAKVSSKAEPWDKKAPSYVEQAMEIIHDGEGCAGICLNCGEQADGVEPDARRYPCDACEKKAVYGCEEIIVMGAPA